MVYAVDLGDWRCDVERLQTFVANLFEGAGMPTQSATCLAKIVVFADLRGAYSHGCALVPYYVSGMLKGDVNANAEPRVAGDSGVIIRVDADNAQGHLGVAFATERAIERAREMGAAVASIGNSNHCGAMAYYPMLALPHDMIAITTTNSVPTMGWFGALDPILGINPVGIAIPAKEEAPIVIDTSFGAVARGKIAVYAQLGRDLPDGWATDAEGNATVDARKALGGLILPAGGFKGTSFALVAGILSALLSGAAYGTELGDLANGAKPGADGQFVLVLNISAFEDPERFKERIDTIIRQVRASRKAPGVERIFVPGERAAENERRCRAEGVALAPAVRKGLSDLADRLGIHAAIVQ